MLEVIIFFFFSSFSHVFSYVFIVDLTAKKIKIGCTIGKWNLGINKLGGRALPRIPTWRVVELL
jgi:hypothetical protein